jgi:glucose-1-phosphate thymidylyltransferase
MKGIILAGGTGSRLLPLTKVTNKHLLPIGKKPMIFYPIESMVEAGITDIMIISGTSHMGSIFELLGSGKLFSCKFTYRVQDTPNGIGGALNLCKDFIGNSPCLVILGDNIFDQNLTKYVKEYKEKIKEGCMLFLRKVNDPHRYGVATFNKNNQLVKITEKPEVPDSNYCITGIYIYDSNVFDIIKKVNPSKRKEIEVTDINNIYLKTGKVFWREINGKWTDAGTWESYRYANNNFFKL